MNILKRARDWIFLPPYSGVPWLVWFYIVIAIFSFRHGGVFTGHLTGFDDHARMTQILNWVNGADWYDRVIRRVNAPEGFRTIWSRFVDLPAALVIMFVQNFVPQRTAALVASVVIPMAEIAVLFPVMRYFARPLVGKKDSWLVTLFILFTSVVTYRAYFSMSGFHPGEASHHSWYVILDAAMFGATARIIMGAWRPKACLILALSIGLLLAVGIESFPMMALAASLLGFTSWLQNRPAVALRGAKGFAAGALVGLLLLPTHQPPAHWLDISFAEPSILGPILIASAALFLVLEALIVKHWRAPQYAQLIGLVLLAGLFADLLVSAFPQILDGPAAGLSPAERDYALHVHIEAMPLHRLSDGLLDFMTYAMPVFIGLVAGVIAIIKAHGPRRRAIAIAYLGFAAASAGMSEIYSRYYHYALTTASAWLLWAWRALMRRLPRNRHFSLAALALFIMLQPFWLLLLPAMENDTPFLSTVLLFPGEAQAHSEICDTLELAKYLNTHYGKDTLILVPAWDSSRFLYYTDLRVDFLANYPSQDKFIDNVLFFETTDPEVARAVALRHHVDLVAVCNARAQHQWPASATPIFQDRLAAGESFPWLKAVKEGFISDYKLYEVDKAALTGSHP